MAFTSAPSSRVNATLPKEQDYAKLIEKIFGSYSNRLAHFVLAPVGGDPLGAPHGPLGAPPKQKRLVRCGAPNGSPPTDWLVNLFE
ncbi:MAG: hypothetical protein FWD58_00830 [Firmicutes bacterium]|nr:hypothetical protein [Bacillota bacterium]